MPRIFSATAATALLAASAAFSPPAAGAGPTDTYLVVLRPAAGDVEATAALLAEQHNGRVGHVYQHALRGFSIEVPARAATAIAASPKVAYVEADQQVSIVGQTTPTGVSRIFAPGNTTIDIDGSDDFRVDADVAVIDTGIDLTHPDLNVVASIDCTNESGGPPWNRTASCLAGGDDDHYHGTHVAGTVAALDNDLGVVGVAPGARLWAVKVLESNGSGSNAMVIAGIDWVAARAGDIEVANMSLGGGFSQALNDAVAGAAADGVTMVVAAGNSDANVASSSPASEPKAVTVSALADFDGEAGGTGSPTCRSDQDDTFADFSNWGTLVDIIAPGVCILSTFPGGAYDTISGTSMAAPHVAGAAALLRSMGKDHATTESQLKTSGNLDWDNGDDPDGAREPLLDVSSTAVFSPTLVATGGGTDPGNSAPTASFTSSCPGLTCSVDGSASTDDIGIVSYDWDFGDGSTAEGVTASHTYGADGTYTVSLIVTDGGGLTDTESRSVSVAGSGALVFSGTSTNQGPTWSAVLTATGLSPGQVIIGSWNVGATQTSCTEGANGVTGSCTITSPGIPKRVSSATWSHADSDAQVTVRKP